MIIIVVMIQPQKNRVGQNADLSNKTTFNNGQLQRYAGSPVGCAGQNVDNSYIDQGHQ